MFEKKGTCEYCEEETIHQFKHIRLDRGYDFYICSKCGRPLYNSQDEEIPCKIMVAIVVEMPDRIREFYLTKRGS